MRLLKEIQKFIKKLTLSVRLLISKYAEPAIETGYVLKELVKNPALDVVVELTKTKIDNKILGLLRKVLSVLFPGIKATKKTANAEYIAEVVSEIRKLSPELQDAVLLKTASLLLKEYAKIDKVNITDSESDLYVQTVFLNKKLA